MSELREEFGCMEPIRFTSSEDVTVYDSNGKEILCKCGKKSTQSLIGQNFSHNFCNDCMPFEELPQGELVYIPLPEQCTPKIQDDWVVNLKESNEE